MKKIICFLFMASLCHIVSAQNKIPEIFIPFYFEDAAANKDTVYIGLDASADNDNNWVDAKFGEKDIKNNPLKLPLDIRAAAYTITIPVKERMRSKVFVIKGDCKNVILNELNLFKHAVLFLYAENFPIKVSWDVSLIDTKCLRGSFFHRYKSSMFNEYDTSRVYLHNKQGNYTITRDYLDNNTIGVEDYSISSTKYIFALQLYLSVYNGDGLVVLHEKSILKKITISPNPVTDLMKLSLNESENVLPNNTQLQILSTNGQLLQQQAVSENTTPLEIDVSALPSSLYFVQLRSPQGLLYTGKFVKIE